MPVLSEHIEDGVATLTFNRPERRNALNEELMAALVEAFPRLGADTSVRAIVLIGAGSVFCSGGDIKMMADSPHDLTYEQHVQIKRPRNMPPLLIRECPKVVIAAINGGAHGAGLALAAACDLRIAVEGTSFNMGFANMAASGDYGGSYLFTKLIGAAKTREMYLLPETFDAAHAQALGLVNRVVPADQFAAEVAAMARRIADGPTVAYTYMKKNLMAAETRSLAEIIDMEVMHQSRTSMSEDHREAAAAFLEKRKPNFKGR